MLEEREHMLPICLRKWTGHMVGVHFLLLLGISENREFRA